MVDDDVVDDEGRYKYTVWFTLRSVRSVDLRADSHADAVRAVSSGLDALGLDYETLDGSALDHSMRHLGW